MAYRLNLADNRLPIFDQSRLPIMDISPALITDILEIADIPVFYQYRGKIAEILPIFRADIWPKPIADILSALTFIDTDNRYLKKCRYIGLTDILVNQYAIPGIFQRPLYI